MPNQIGFGWAWWILLLFYRDDHRRDNSKRQAISSQTYLANIHLVRKKFVNE